MMDDVDDDRSIYLSLRCTGRWVIGGDERCRSPRTIRFVVAATKLTSKHKYTDAHRQRANYTRECAPFYGRHTAHSVNHTDLGKSALVRTLLKMVIVVQDIGHCFEIRMHIIYRVNLN